MANEENLKSLADRTTDEQREIAKKGGIASGKARREKKALHQRIQGELAKQAEKRGIDNGIDVLTIMEIATNMDKPEQALKAWRLLWDFGFEKPTQKVEQSSTNDIDWTQFTKEEILALAKMKGKKDEDN